MGFSMRRVRNLVRPVHWALAAAFIGAWALEADWRAAHEWLGYAAAALVVGEGVRVRLHVKGQGDGLVVPEEAVQNLEGRDVVFVRSQKGFRIQPVLVGIRSGGVAQIVSGVKAGDQVATRNAFLVKADMIKSGKEE